MLNFWLTGNQQTWFLSLLLVAYGMYPFVYGFLYRMRGRVPLKALLLVLLGAAFVLLVYRLAPSSYKKVEIALTRLPIFLIGCAMGRTVYERRCVERNAGPLLIVLAAVFIASIWLLNQGLLKGMQTRFFYILPGSAITLLLGWLFAAVKSKGIHRFFRFFGSMSLELYLAHLIGLTLYQRSAFYREGSLGRYLLALAVCTAAAFAASKVDNWLLAKIKSQKQTQ